MLICSELRVVCGSLDDHSPQSPGNSSNSARECTGKGAKVSTTEPTHRRQSIKAELFFCMQRKVFTKAQRRELMKHRAIVSSVETRYYQRTTQRAHRLTLAFSMEVTLLEKYGTAQGIHGITVAGPSHESPVLMRESDAFRRMASAY
jgi:hypothetical protein